MSVKPTPHGLSMTIADPLAMSAFELTAQTILIGVLGWIGLGARRRDELMIQYYEINASELREAYRRFANASQSAEAAARNLGIAFGSSGLNDEDSEA